MNSSFQSDLDEGLQSVLECPICTEYMAAPILQCNSGHSICSKCMENVTQCPICRTAVNNPVRNYSLEKLSEQFKVTCRNKEHGCHERFLRENIKKHETFCPFREYECPMSKNLNVRCAWKGPRNDILNHAIAHHPLSTFSLEDQPFSFTFYLNNDYEHDVELLFLEHHLFLSHDIYDRIERKCWKIVQYLGPSINASKFKYKVHFFTKSKSRSLIYSRQVHSEEETIASILEKEDCFTMAEEQIRLYLVDDGPLMYNEWSIL